MTRIDKYLWAIRVYKTRSIAAAELKKGRVAINGIQAKQSSKINLNDLITVKKDGIVYSYKVINFLDKRVGAKLVSEYVMNTTSKEEMEKKLELQLLQSSYRKTLQEGKPSKKDKRSLKKFLEE